MRAEILAIGTELLLGEIVDTNSAYLARALRDLGLDVFWISAVGDNEARIVEAISHALARSQVILTTGGLGPTVDDPTREAIARACQRPLEYHPELWEQISARFTRWGRAPSENNRRQAYIPTGALALPNPVGTAPSFIVEHAQRVIISLPGVPREMEHLLTQAVVPYLRRKFSLTGIIKAKILRTVGLGESRIDELIGEFERLANPTVGLAAHAGQTDVRLTAKAGSEAEAEALIAPLEAQIRARLGEVIYGEGKETIEEVTARLLAARGQSVAVIEAGSGGQLAARLSALPQAPTVFRGGRLMPLAPALSAPALAETIRADYQAEWGLSLVLDLQAEAGQMRLALSGPRSETRALGYAGPPAMATTWASTTALNLLRQVLLKPEVY